MTLRAGCAVRDICPSKPMALFGYPHVERISRGVHDPILATALYLDNGQTQLVLISLDILLLEPDEVAVIRQEIARQLSIPEWHVFLHTTHTHSGPISGTILAWSLDPSIPKPDRDYLDHVREQAVAAAVEASNSKNLEPAELAWATGDARGVGGNRLSPDGPTDPEVGILAVRKTADKTMLGMVVNYGVHPTVLHEDSPLISSDFPHYTRVHLKERFGDGLTVVYQMAPSGNQSPRHFVDGQTFEEAERLGRQLGTAVVDAFEKLDATAFTDSPELSGTFREVKLPRREIPSLDESKKLLDEYRATYERLKNSPDALKATSERPSAPFSGPKAPSGWPRSARPG